MTPSDSSPNISSRAAGGPPRGKAEPAALINRVAPAKPPLETRVESSYVLAFASPASRGREDSTRKGTAMTA